MLVIQGAVSIECENRHQVAIDEVGFGETSRNVQAIQLVIVEFKPLFEIAKTAQGVVARNIST